MIEKEFIGSKTLGKSISQNTDINFNCGLQRKKDPVEQVLASQQAVLPHVLQTRQLWQRSGHCLVAELM
jgi:hypothetical protein